MLKLTRIPVATMLAVACAACAPLASPSIQTTAGEDALSWLAGCWATEDQTVEETWTGAKGGAHLFGFSVTTNSGQATFFEQLRIDVESDIHVLNAYPKGVGPTRFEQDRTGTQLVSFINAEHDYPQRITYERIGAELRATISNLDDSNANRWSYWPCEN